MNNVTALGRLTKDPETRYVKVKDGEDFCVARFTLAVNRPGKNKEADFIACEAVGKTAEICEKYLSKGKQIAIEGAIRTGRYEKNGNTVYTWVVRLSRIEFCGKKEDGGEKADDKVAGNDGWDYLEEYLPFA
jgi:single-strand DNA-binding protein